MVLEATGNETALFGTQYLVLDFWRSGGWKIPSA